MLMKSIYKQHGTSMIEVLVALLILSVGLLGLAMLQGKSMRLNTDALLRSQATLVANSIIEEMRANTLGAKNGFYEALGGKPTACSACTDANGEKRANGDLIKWYEQQADFLPFPESVIEYDVGTGIYKITVKWNERGQTVKQIWEVKI